MSGFTHSSTSLSIPLSENAFIVDTTSFNEQTLVNRLLEDLQHPTFLSPAIIKKAICFSKVRAGWRLCVAIIADMSPDSHLTLLFKWE